MLQVPHLAQSKGSTRPTCFDDDAIAALPRGLTNCLKLLSRLGRLISQKVVEGPAPSGEGLPGAGAGACGEPDVMRS